MRKSELILCGAEEAFVLAFGAGEPPPFEKVWSWRAETCPDIPDDLKPCFRSTDDCKPVDGGRRIAISSSSGAVALVDRQTRRASFWAPVANAHSIELLPGGRIVAAASGGKTPQHSRIILFDGASMAELASYPMAWAHGVVWDEDRRRLWALGENALRGYSLAGDLAQPSALQIESTTTIPFRGSHNLSPIPGSPDLFISTEKHCMVFDRDELQLRPHGLLGDVADVKSFSLHPVTGRLAYTQGQGEHWWTDQVHFLNPDGLLTLPGQRLYKARWA